MGEWGLFNTPPFVKREQRGLYPLLGLKDNSLSCSAGFTSDRKDAHKCLYANIKTLGIIVT